MVDVAPQAVTQIEAAAKPSPARYYVLGLLTLVYALNFLDRTIFNVLIEPINQHYGWRMAFFAAGLPGVALATVLWLTVSEPRRGAQAETFKPETLGPTLRFLMTSRTFLIVLIGFWLTTFTNYATAVWIPPFLARVHHLSSAEI